MTANPNVSTQTVDALLRQAALGRATSLAHSGRYAEAEAALAIREDEDKATLDLLARIRAQQGRFAEAQTLWLKAMRQDPNPVYLAALKRLAGRRSSLKGFWLRRSLALAFLVLVLVGTSLGLRRFWRLDVAAPAVESRPTTQAPRLAESPKFSLVVAGTTQSTNGRETVVRFDRGLFTDLTRMAPGTETLLKELGKRLEPYSGQIEVRVTGYCDDLPLAPAAPYPNNRALGLARADAVARYLATNTTLPLTIFSLQAGTANDPPADRARDRTVDLRVFNHSPARTD